MKGGYFNMSLFWVFGLKGRTSENCRSLKDLGKLYARSEATLIMPVVKLLPPFAMEEMKLWSHLSGKRFLRCLSWDGCWLLAAAASLRACESSGLCLSLILCVTLPSLPNYPRWQHLCCAFPSIFSLPPSSAKLLKHPGWGKQWRCYDEKGLVPGKKGKQWNMKETGKTSVAH